MSEINTERVRAWLKLGLQGPWTIDGQGMMCDVRGTPFMRVWPQGADLNAHDFAAAAPDLARAYLAEHARAEAAEAERDRLQSEVHDLTAKLQTIMGADCGYECEIARLAARVAELEAAAVPVEWREGVPSVADVRAHEGRGGLWASMGPVNMPEFCRLRTKGDIVEIDPDGTGQWYGPVGGRTGCISRPYSVNGNPLSWPVHGAEGVADAS